MKYSQILLTLHLNYIKDYIMKDEKVRPQLNIEIPAELEEVYSNLAVIAHSSSEFVFDFLSKNK